MLDLNPAQTGQERAQGAMTKFQAKRDADSENTLTFKIGVAFTISNSVDAEKADKIVPGALRAFENATDEGSNWKTRSTVDPNLTNVRLTLADPSRPEAPPQQTSASCRQVNLRSSKRATVLEYIFTIGGQPPGAAVMCLGLLGRVVAVTVGWDNVLPFRERKADDDVIDGVDDDEEIEFDDDLVIGDLDTNTLVSAVIEGQDEVHGLWLRRADPAKDALEADHVIKDLNGEEYAVAESEIVAVLQLADNAENTKQLRQYKSRCTRGGHNASAACLILALTTADTRAEDGTWAVTKDVVDHALQITSQPVTTLPTEPGESAGDLDEDVAQAGG